MTVNGMAKKTPSKARPKRKRWVAVSLAGIALIVALSVDSYYYYSNRKPPQLKDSSQYFAISNLAGLYRATQSNASDQNPGRMILITQFDFNFTPIGGDATDVRIFINQVDPATTSWEGITIPNGTSTLASAHTDLGVIMPLNSLPSYRQGDGTYTLKIRIVCEEADGYVTLRFTPGDNIFRSG